MTTITTTKGSVTDALKAVKPAIYTRNGALPILSHVRVDVFNRTVTFTATDLDLTITQRLEGATKGRATSALVPWGDIDKIAKHAPDKDVTITLDNGNATFKSGSFKFDAASECKLEEWPQTFEVGDEGQRFEIDGTILNRVAPFASNDDARPIMTGVHIDHEGVYAASNSYFLAMGRPGLAAPSRPVLIPHAAASLVPADTVTVAANDTWIVFEHDGLMIRSRLIEGEYPNWRSLVPEKFEHTVVCPAKELSKAVNLIGKFCENGTPIRMRRSPDATLEVLVSKYVRSDQKMTTMNVPATWYNGAPAAAKELIAFNPSYLEDALRGAGADDDGNVTLKIVDHLKPAMFFGDEIVDVLLMPIRVA